MILVTGATGTVGSQVTKLLLEKGQQIRVFTRDPAKAAKFTGAEVAKGDYADLGSLDTALKGIDKAFLLSAGPTMVRDESNFIDAAKRAGVKHVVLLSVMGADQPESGPIAAWHAAGEKKLKESGIAWTFVRPGMFSSNALNWVGSIKAEGKFYTPTGDGKAPMIDPRDIAEVAVAALLDDKHRGQAYTLTGDVALSGKDQASALSAAIGKPVTHVDIPGEVAKQHMLKAGMPEALAAALIGFNDAVRHGHATYVSPDVEKVLGRKPRSFEAWAKDHAAAYK